MTLGLKEGMYNIQCVSSSKYLYVYENSTKPGYDIKQRELKNQANYQFHVKKYDDEHNIILVVSSGLFVRASDDPTKPEAPVRQQVAKFDGQKLSSTELWSFIEGSVSGTYKVQCLKGGLFWTIAGESKKNDAPLQMNRSKDSYQEFSFSPI